MSPVPDYEGLYEDLAKLAVDAGIATSGVDLFVSSTADIPSGPGPYTNLREYPGLTNEETHNAGRFEKPAVQVMTFASDARAARSASRAFFDAFSRVRNQTVNGRFYQSITARQPPFDFGLDENQRVRYVFNIIAKMSD